MSEKDEEIEIPLKNHSVSLIINDDFMASLVIDGVACNAGLSNVSIVKPALESGKLLLTVDKDLFKEKNILGKQLLDEAISFKRLGD